MWIYRIAESYPPHGGEKRTVDVSHRGGKPGFVRVGDDGTLTIPDFVGNFLFNTLGNLLLNPRAGLVIADFGTGDMLFLSGVTEIVWSGPEDRELRRRPALAAPAAGGGLRFARRAAAARRARRIVAELGTYRGLEQLRHSALAPKKA